MGDYREFRKRYGLGDRTHYRLAPAPLGSGGQADVFRGLHKATNLEVAFKRLRGTDPDDIARMRREIEIGRTILHRHVMPVLDADEGSTWLVMPLAACSLEAGVDSIANDNELRELVEHICAGLGAAHEKDYVHRDLKPSNVLLLDGAWVVSDWGLVRRPTGQTTDPRRTVTGVPIGTAGFAAPELTVAPHDAGPTADIYSLGQIIGWVITRTWPNTNIPLLPPSGPWRSVARQATQIEPAKRPPTVDSLLEMVNFELLEPPVSVTQLATTLLSRELSPSADTAVELFRLAANHPANYDLYIDFLPRMSEMAIAAAVRGNPRIAEDVSSALARHVDADYGRRNFVWLNAVILFSLWIAKVADSIGDIALLETAVDCMFDWDDAWDRWRAQKEILSWLQSLRGESARIAATSLRAHSQSVMHFGQLMDIEGADPRLRAAVSTTF